MTKHPDDTPLFDGLADEARARIAPLAVRMRPRTLDEYLGQDAAVGKGRWLRGAIENDTLSSVLLYGPAGTGKTTLARIIASMSDAEFVEVSAVSGGVAELREAIAGAEERLRLNGRRTILFVDEIHRFNKTQQDSLLHAVEDRTVVLVGATTENPLFEVNGPLISRSRVVELKPLPDVAVATLVKRACEDSRGYGGSVRMEADALDAIVLSSGGDARTALTTLELAAGCVAADRDGVRIVTVGAVREAAPTTAVSYDKSGDAHYDVVSAFIKSMRGSDPDAALYWMARMLAGGEDPKFVARRMLIAASEDVGNADPQALLVAEAAFRAAEVIGMPECRINLAQAAVYLSLAPKSNASYLAIDAALEEVRTGPARVVPAPLRDRHRPGSGHYGEYLYPHAHDGGWVAQRYLPEGLGVGAFYAPGSRGWEAERAEALRRLRDGNG